MNNDPSPSEVRHPNALQGFGSLHAAVFLFGLSGFLGKMVAAPPSVIVFSRAFLAALALGVLTWLRPTKAAAKSWLFFMGSGAVLAVHWLAFFQAIQVSTVAIGLLSFSSFPLFVALLEPVLFREKFRHGDLLASVFVMAGLVLVVPNFDLSQHLTQGAACGVASGLTFALLSLLNRRFVRDLPPITIGAGQNAFAAVFLLPFLPSNAWRLTAQELLLLLVLGLLCTACAHVLFIRGLAVVRAQTASVLAALEPVYGITFAWIILRETPSFRTMLGGLIILGATSIATWKHRNTAG